GPPPVSPAGALSSRPSHRLGPVPKTSYSEVAAPKFAQAPPLILLSRAREFFVDEAAARGREGLRHADTPGLRVEGGPSGGAVSDALLNRSLFSARRVVELDASRLLGTDSPGDLVVRALEAWGRGGAGGRREAFRHVRALLAALELSGGADPVETAEAAAKKT